MSINSEFWGGISWSIGGIIMKMYMVYKCEYCDFESKSFAETQRHETEHFGLTIDEFHHWNNVWWSNR